ncbi:Alpha-L-arabinofuranosidase [Paenibacillus algorifonticola]|uniref:non-reducing end alpha-L-arabinofuranosidase n=1 Tax=Paenibacillus algorifonticola TaxID=684063 RepID=A0A1I2HP11_9BACL|nr:alpha-L-arabinofuranosidase C-terminal domain-containing protein [Paenibacillus algorifonticola]SFF31884.1 Alpha-L-arabinofuranosidase [Paenibacillus algorifonticola]
MKINITNQRGPAIEKGMIGLFFEDINYGLDGGLHAEMIENRSFEFLETTGHKGSVQETYAGLYGWSAFPQAASGAILNIETNKPQNTTNPHYLAFTATDSQKAFTNKAYDGVCLKKDAVYYVSFYARAENYSGGIEVFVEKNDKIMAFAEVTSSVKGEWIQYKAELRASEAVSYGAFVIQLNEPGTVCFDFISMLPADAVLGLFRKDLVELLKDMKPGFLRFPGGCVVEGYSLDNRYQWKHSIGKAEERKPNTNRWALHGNHEENQFTSPYSHYNQTLGIGYYEYFLLCEYLGAKAIPVLNVGLACQYQSDELVCVDTPAFQEYIDDALDLIEFANGPADSPWGLIRAQMGHPKPFGLEMIGLGNEQWETEHVDFYKRSDLFQQAIHRQYPAMKLIGSAGPDISSENYENAWKYYKDRAAKNPDFVYAVDEHYYVKPEWLCENVHFYDKYPRNIKVFAGEYAAHHGNGMNSPHFNNWSAALGEAAFMTGLERNADVVVLASYAPLFARLGYSQWSPDMIWLDGEHSYGSPSYYVQKMYSTLMGSELLKVICDEEVIPFTVSYDEEEGVIFVKLVNTLDRAVRVELKTEFPLAEEAEVYIMQGGEDDVNSIELPLSVAPQRHEIKVASTMEYEVNAKSFHVIKMFCKDGK